MLVIKFYCSVAFMGQKLANENAPVKSGVKLKQWIEKVGSLSAEKWPVREVAIRWGGGTEVTRQPCARI